MADPSTTPPEEGPEPLPSVRQDDAIERTGRTEAVVGESQTSEPGEEPNAPAVPGDLTGPAGDPAEGKR
jgi:hypothetical protein